MDLVRRQFRAPNMSAFSSFCVFITFALSLVISNGYSYGPALLLVTFLIASYRIDYLGKLDSLGKIIVLSFFLYFINLAFDIVYHEMPFREYDRPSRLLFALGVMFLLIKYPPKASYFWLGLSLGCVTAGLMAFWQKFFLGVGRPPLHMSQIQFGNLAMLMGLLCFVGAVSKVKGCERFRSLLIMGSFFGVLASLLSGSRGGWIGFPVIVIFIVGCYVDSKARALKLMALPLIFLIVLVMLLPQLGVKDRFERAIADVEEYFDEHKTHTSVGTRLELWRAGLIMFPDKPFLGWGEDGYAAEKARLADEGVVGNSIRYNSHLHNDFMDALVIRGAVGLFILLLFYLLPLTKILSLLVERRNPNTRPYLVSMAVVIFCYIDFGLTQVFWAHNSGAMFYSFIIVFLYVFYLKEVEENEGRGGANA